MQNPLQIIQERHRLALHLLALLHSFNPPPPSPWSCSSCPGPVGEGKGYLWRMLSLSSRLHHLLSMPSRAGKKTAYTRGVCMHAHTHGDKQAGGRMVTGCRRQREGEVGVLLFFQKKKKISQANVWSGSQAARRLETLSLPSAAQHLFTSLYLFFALCLR